MALEDKKSSCRASKAPIRLSTHRLRPYRQKHNRSVMSILEDGRVCIELLKEDKVKEVLLISGDGDEVSLFRPNNGKGLPLKDTPLTQLSEGDSIQVHRFADLPPKLVGKYNLAADFVQLNRTITPKVTLFGSEAKCMVMESGNPADYQVAFYDGSKIVARAKSGVKLIESDGTTTAFPAATGDGSQTGDEDEKALKHLNPRNREKWKLARECLQKCHQLESALSGIESMWNAGCGAASANPSIFPAVFGRQPSSSTSGTTTTTPSSQSSPASSKPSPRLRLSPSSMPSVTTSILSRCDASVVTVVSNKNNHFEGDRRTRSILQNVDDRPSKMPYGREHNNRVERDGSSSLNAVCQLGGPKDAVDPSRAYDSSPMNAAVSLPGICRASALPSGVVRLDFDDGTRLCVEAGGAKAGANRFEFTDVAGRIRRFGGGVGNLPGEVADKVKHLPTVLDKFAALGIQ